MNILITGISSGIGKALCRELIISGQTVWGVARRKDLLDSLNSELKSDNFLYSVCDVSNEEAVKKVVLEMAEADFLPEVVVLNAGIERKDSIDGYQNKISQEVFSVNFFGALKWVELFIKKFTERRSGQFIAISSIFALRPDIDSVCYCASKSALSMAFRSLSLQYIKKKIIFTNIYLGPVDTNISSRYQSKAARPKKSLIIMSPQDAARCIIKAIKGQRATYYFPFYIALPVRLTFFLSDLKFYKLTRFFRR
jgi:short-subunit dehydrogenase